MLHVKPATFKLRMEIIDSCFTASSPGLFAIFAVEL
jgi:hypothetical protein